ncbi:MAG TPA: CDP-alcohol phosphatidyltransferase family protein, partial [Chloroflexota bacterium]|nr:CDP-alcohol phosphatidyltransferase family protein [Chloroflexota bacterium]
MFDERMRRAKDKAFTPLAHRLLAVPPWLFSVLGLLTGLAAAAALWQQQYAAGFALWFLNRAFDGLDGAVARARNRQSDFGGYLDIVVDFVVYAAIPVGLALGVGGMAVSLSLLFLL